MVTSPTPRGQRTAHGLRHKNRFVAAPKVRLEATEVKMLRRLCEAYGRNAADLIRGLIREKYAELYASAVMPEDVSFGGDAQ